MDRRTYKEIISVFQSWKYTAEQRFDSYSRRILLSKLQNKYSYIYMPPVEGFFLSLKNLTINSDVAVIEKNKLLTVRTKKEQIFFYSMLDSRVMPFDITFQNLESGRISLTLINNNHDFFQIKDNEIHFWFHPMHYSNILALNIFNSFQNQISVTYHLSSGEIVKTSVLAKYSEINYIQNHNQVIKNTISEPRLGFKISISLNDLSNKSFKKINLSFESTYQGLISNNLKNCFYANIIPMGNQAKLLSRSFYVDGSAEYYLLSVDIDTEYYIYGVSCLLVDDNVIDKSFYSIIYDNNKVYVEFHKLEGIYKKNVSAYVYIHIIYSRSIFNQNCLLHWTGGNISYYELDCLDCVETTKSQPFKQKLEPLQNLLNIESVSRWTIESWKQLFIFFDQYTDHGIHNCLYRVRQDGKQIYLYFTNDNDDFKVWLDFYIHQVNKFLIYNMTYHDVILVGIYR